MYHLNLGSEMSPLRSVVLPCARDMPNEGAWQFPVLVIFAGVTEE